MLITDIDILRIEPRVFIDAASTGTTLLSGADGVLSGTTLSSAGSDFEATEIDAGRVAVVNGEALEIDSRSSATALEISRPRVEDVDPAIAPDSGSALAFDIITFDRLASQAQTWVLGSLGIDPDHPEQPLDETAIVDATSVARLIALRAIARAYELASATTPADEALAQQATIYRRLAHAALHQTVAWLDLDGDGIPDATRRIDLVTFTRR